jgi:hypothetical protein
MYIHTLCRENRVAELNERELAKEQDADSK